MGVRFKNDTIAILSENVKVRFKASGGVYFVDENGDEMKKYILGRKTRQNTDEVKRDYSQKALYKGFELKVIPQALPVTINYLGADALGGQPSASYNLSNLPSDKLRIVEDYIKRSIWVTIRINQFETWRALADTKADTLEMPAIATAKDELALELVDDRTGTNFVYDQYFIDTFPNGSFLDTINGQFITPEVIVQNLNKELGTVSDLDIDIKINFYGSLDFQVLNS